MNRSRNLRSVSFYAWVETKLVSIARKLRLYVFGVLQIDVGMFDFSVVTCGILIAVFQIRFTNRLLLSIENAFEMYFFWGLVTFMSDLLSFSCVSLNFDNHFIYWRTRSSKFLRKLKVQAITHAKINILSILYLLKLFNCFQIISLHRIMQSMHLIGSTKLVKIKELQILLYDFFLTFILNLANILYICKEFLYSGLFTFINLIYQMVICSIRVHEMPSVQELVIITFLFFYLPFEMFNFTNCIIEFNNEIKGVILIFHAS